MKKIVIFSALFIFLNIPCCFSFENEQGLRLEGIISAVKIEPKTVLYSVIYGENEKVRIYLENGVSPDETYFGIPLTFFASYYKQHEVLKTLLEFGANTNKKYLGLNLFDFAVYGRRYETISILLNSGEKIDDKKGQKYVHYAIRKNDCETAKILIQNGVKPDNYSIKKIKKSDNEELKALIDE